MRAAFKLALVTAVLVVSLVVPASAQAFWGAIAVDPASGRVGLARQQVTAVEAKEIALARCGGGKCKVAVWIFNGYGALVQKQSGVYIAGLGKTKNLAFRDARDRAHERAARPVAWVFSGLS